MQAVKKRIDEANQQQVNELPDDFLDVDEVIEAVMAMKGHWVGDFLAVLFMSCYRIRPAKINIGQFCNLDAHNKRIFNCIVNMRKYPGWSDEVLYLTMCKLEELTGLCSSKYLADNSVACAKVKR